MQCYQIGIYEYITDLQNIQTVIFVNTGILNGIYHYIYGPYNLTAKCIMILNLIFAL